METSRILFIRNGRFSFTNDSLVAQIRKRFPRSEITDHDVARDTYRSRSFFIANTLRSMMEYGAREVLFKGRRGFYFFRTQYFFENACRRFYARARREGKTFDLIIQTQGIFDGAFAGAPLLIYTDYTYRSLSFGGAPAPQNLIESERKLFRSADAIAVSAEHVRDTLVGSYGCQPERVRTVFIGSNSTMAAQPADAARFSSRRICFVGIDFDRKGGPDLVRAFALVLQRYPDATLVIAGASPGVSQDGIEVLGRIPQADVAKLYRTSAVFCLPSHVEPSSVAAIEAATHGLPIVATRLGGFVDSVVDGVTGLLVPPKDPEALAEALCQLIGDPARAEQMGAAGRGHALDRFDWDRVGEKVARLASEISRVRP